MGKARSRWRASCVRGRTDVNLCDPYSQELTNDTEQQPFMRTKSDIAEADANGRGVGTVAPAVAIAAADTASAPNEFHSFLADIEDLITSMTPLTGEDLARAKAKLSERVAAARESVTVMGSEIAHQARKTARVTNDYVQENPWQAVGIGAVLGLLIGVTVARRK